MNKKFKRPLLGILGAVAAFGGVLSAAIPTQETIEPARAPEFAYRAADTAATDTTVEMKAFTATSGSLDAVVSYTTAKGGGTANPSISNGVIRLYQNGDGEAGGSISLSVEDGYLLKEIEIGSSMTTSIKYTIGDSTDYQPSTAISIAENGTYTLSGISNDADVTKVTFHCFGTDKNHRLYVNSLRVVYGSSIVAVEDEKATSLSLEMGDASGVLYQGKEFDSTGYLVKLTYTSESDPSYLREEILNPTDEKLTWNYDLSTVGFSSLSVTYTDGDLSLKSNSISVEVKEQVDMYSYAFKSGDIKENQDSLEANGITWNVCLDPTSPYIGIDSNKGLQFGSGNNPIDRLSLSSYFIGESGCTNVSSITVNASTASSGNARLQIFLNGQEKGSFALTTSAADYAIDNLSGYGVVEIRIVNSAEKAVYIKSIDIIATKSEEGKVLVPLASELANFDSCNLANSDFQTFKTENEATIEQYTSELESLMILDKASQNQSGDKDTYYSFMDKYNYCLAALPGGANYMGNSLLGETDGTMYALVASLAVMAAAGGLAFLFYKKRKEAR